MCALQTKGKSRWLKLTDSWPKRNNRKERGSPRNKSLKFKKSAKRRKKPSLRLRKNRKRLTRRKKTLKKPERDKSLRTRSRS